MIIDNYSIKKVLLVSLACAALSACEHKSAVEINYFNVDSVVDAQVVLLQESGAFLIKRTAFDNKKDSTVASVKDSIGWANELGVFRQLDEINKPVNKGLYTISDTSDTKSNLRIRTFTTTKELPVKSLKVYYHDSFANIRKVEGKYLEKNYLYISSINLSLDFDNLYNKITLTNYSITGGQKMFLGDTVSFTIHGKVKIN